MKLIKIDSIEKKNGKKTVYDIEVDTEHQYIANGYVVHNCTSAANGGTYYPRASLLDEINDARIKWEYDNGKVSPTKVIADGGIRNFDDIQKCLALGADFVMIGNAFAKSEEACGKLVYINPEEFDDYLKGNVKGTSEEYYHSQIKYLTNKLKESNTPERTKMFQNLLDEWYRMQPYREYFGMSCRTAQRLMGGLGNKTSEGISRPVLVEYPIAKWADNMKSYLISTMSYAGCYDLDEFRNNTEIIINYSGDKAYRK